MRVVAGTARGRRLVAPDGTGTRPTSDRVREATFNALGSLGAIEGAAVLDLFAGSGALGIEALSRGAASATFVDSERSAIAAIRANLASTALAERAEVVPTTADRFLDAATAASRHWDVALLDPPYTHDDWDTLLVAVPAGIAVIEAGRAVEPPDGWEVLRSKRYGSTTVTIARKVSLPTT